MKREGNDEFKGQQVVTSSSRRWIILAAFLLVVGTGATALWLLRGTDRSNRAGRPVPTPDFDVAPPAYGGAAPRPGDLLITIQPDQLENAHFKIEAAVTLSGSSINTSVLRATGTVEPNAYRVVPVMPIAGGIVKQVNFALGEKVGRGQKLATIFSTELADAQTAYLSILAEIEKHHQKYKRAEKLVEIGAASREEFEEVSAEYKIEEARLTAARQRLLLLGMSVKQIDELRDSNQMGAMISVEAPVSGTILSRSVNAGEVVTMGKELFRITDLSTVWVIGQIYEKEFAIVGIGMPVIITTQAYSGRRFAGRISYIDSRVETQTRTAQIRVEVKNPNDMLKLGMFVEVNFGRTPATGGQAMVSVPRNAVQMIGTKQVVFVVTDKTGVFAQRQVSAGAESDGKTPVFAGLYPGERVVTEGSFLLRAESLKLNPSQLTGTQITSAVSPQAGEKQSKSTQTSQNQTQSVTVILSDKGYQPESIKLLKGIPARVTYVRKVEATCGTEIVLAEYNIKRELPLNQAVVIEFTPTKTGEFTFACGMDMLRGKIIVR